MEPFLLPWKRLEISQKRPSASISNTGQNSTDERRPCQRQERKKNSSFQTTITKSVFLYGRPNKEKLAILQQMQNSYIALINRDIELLEKNPDIVLQLVKNDKKDPQMRKLEKAIRPKESILHFARMHLMRQSCRYQVV